MAVAGDGDSGLLKGPQLLEALNERSNFGAPDVSAFEQTYRMRRKRTHPGGHILASALCRGVWYLTPSYYVI